MTHSLSLAMPQYSKEPRTRKYVKDMDFYHLQEIIKNNYGIQD